MSAVLGAAQNELSREHEKDKIHCRFCNDFAHNPPMEPVSLEEWVEGITQSSCEFCRILVREIQMLEPSLLGGEARCDKDAAVDLYPRRATPMKGGSIEVSRYEFASTQKSVYIRWTKDGWSTRFLSIELYTTDSELPCPLCFRILFLQFNQLILTHDKMFQQTCLLLDQRKTYHQQLEMSLCGHSYETVYINVERAIQYV